MKVTDVKRNSCLLYNLTKCTACLQRVATTNHMFVRFKSHYDELGLTRNASQKEIRDAYIKLSKKLHPDQNQQDRSSHNKFVKVKEAYEVLSKESSRNEYDSDFYRRHQPSKTYSANRSSQRPPNYYSSGQNYTDNNYYNNTYYDPYSRRGQQQKEDPFSSYGYEEYQRQRNGFYSSTHGSGLDRRVKIRLFLIFSLLMLAVDKEIENTRNDIAQNKRNLMAFWLIIICMVLPSFLHVYIRVHSMQMNFMRSRSTPNYSSRQERIAKYEEQRKRLEMSFLAFLIFCVIFVIVNILTVELPFINKNYKEDAQEPIVILFDKISDKSEIIYKYSSCIMVVMIAVMICATVREYVVEANLKALIEKMEAEAWESGSASYKKALLYVGLYVAIAFYLSKKEIERKMEIKKKKSMNVESNLGVAQFKDS